MIFPKKSSALKKWLIAGGIFLLSYVMLWFASVLVVDRLVKRNVGTFIMNLEKTFMSALPFGIEYPIELSAEGQRTMSQCFKELESQVAVERITGIFPVYWNIKLKPLSLTLPKTFFAKYAPFLTHMKIQPRVHVALHEILKGELPLELRGQFYGTAHLDLYSRIVVRTSAGDYTNLTEILGFSYKNELLARLDTTDSSEIIKGSPARCHSINLRLKLFPHFEKRMKELADLYTEQKHMHMYDLSWMRPLYHPALKAFLPVEVALESTCSPSAPSVMHTQQASLVTFFSHEKALGQMKLEMSYERAPEVSSKGQGPVNDHNTKLSKVTAKVAIDKPLEIARLIALFFGYHSTQHQGSVRRSCSYVISQLKAGTDDRCVFDIVYDRLALSPHEGFLINRFNQHDLLRILMKFGEM